MKDAVVPHKKHYLAILKCERRLCYLNVGFTFVLLFYVQYVYAEKSKDRFIFKFSLPHQLKIESANNYQPT